MPARVEPYLECLVSAEAAAFSGAGNDRLRGNLLVTSAASLHGPAAEDPYAGFLFQ
jgi:hypothetical protein